MALVGSGSGELVSGSRLGQRAVAGNSRLATGEGKARSSSKTVFSNGIALGETARGPTKAKRPSVSADEGPCTDIPETARAVTNGGGLHVDGAANGALPFAANESGAERARGGSGEETDRAGKCGGGKAELPNGAESGGVCLGGEAVFAAGGSAEYDSLIENVIECLDEKIDKSTLTAEALDLLSLIPDGYIPLPHQVGGHRHVDGKLGFLRRVGLPSVLFKPVQAGIKGQIEMDFYRKMFESGYDPSLTIDVQQLRGLIPRYYGTEIIRDRAGHLHEFMMLEDLTAQFHCPSILDVKIGRRVWDDFAEQDKIDREMKKYPEQDVLGFRIIGMRAYQPLTGDYKYYDKFFGRSVREDGALQAVSCFFDDGTSQSRKDLIAPMAAKLRQFLNWFEQNTTLKLFATSLLIVFEGDRSVDECKIEIRLVDFAHAYKLGPGDCTHDENALFGMRNFLAFLGRVDKLVSSRDHIC